MEFSQQYKETPEVIRAAQVCGARVTKNLFPRWMVDKYFREGKITVTKIDKNLFEVCVKDGNKEETMTCNGTYEK